jgi:hypothetical protein
VRSEKSASPSPPWPSTRHLPGGFRVTTARDLTYRQVWPGALAAALTWQILQWFGVGYIAHTVKTASATNSVFALVLGMLAFLFVLVERLYPRALLAPFTDDADLTQADRATYSKKPKPNASKHFARQRQLPRPEPKGHPRAVTQSRHCNQTVR